MEEAKRSLTVARYIGVVLLSLVVASQALAHGIGTPVKINVPSGPYLLSIWTDPDPLRVKETHVTVAVMEPVTREPIVTGLTVEVQLTDVVDEAMSFTAAATPEDSANRLLYAAVFSNLPHEGTWRGTIVVDGLAGKGEPIPFEIEVLPQAPFNWLWPGVGGLVILLVVWWIRTWPQQARPSRPSKGKDTAVL